MRRLERRFRFSSAQKNGLKLFQLKKNVKETFSVQERKEEEKDISNSRVAKECSKFCVFLRDSRVHHFFDNNNTSCENFIRMQRQRIHEL